MKYLKGPQNNADPNDLEGYAAHREGAAVVDRSDRRLLRLTGRDPIGMLNAVLTNDVPAHGDRGIYAMLLDPKGRIQTDLRVVKAGDETLIDSEQEGAQAAKEILARYAPFSRVRLEELSGWDVLGLYGPRATGLLGNPDLTEHEAARAEIGGASVLVVGVAVPVSGYDLIGPPEALASALTSHPRISPASRRTPWSGPSASGRVATRARRRWRGCITVAARTRSSTASSWSPARWNRLRREMRSCRAKGRWAQSPR